MTSRQSVGPVWIGRYLLHESSQWRSWGSMRFVVIRYQNNQSWIGLSDHNWSCLIMPCNFISGYWCTCPYVHLTVAAVPHDLFWHYEWMSQMTAYRIDTLCLSYMHTQSLTEIITVKCGDFTLVWEWYSDHREVLSDKKKFKKRYSCYFRGSRQSGTKDDRWKRGLYLLSSTYSFFYS